MQAVLDQIRHSGPLPFDVYVDAVLYGPGGFYASGAGAGRRDDFLTSPEVGPLYGAVLARALDTWWAELGRPDPFTVVEGGAGTGTLARTTVAARPACLPALRYVLVERSAALRARQPHVAPFVSAEQLPAGPLAGVVLANELLDNLGFLLVERGQQAWLEVRVGADGQGLSEVLVPAAPDIAAEADLLVPDAPEGGRFPLQRQAADWLRRALELLDRGRVVVVDYADTTPSFASRGWGQWVRTYRAHGRGGSPLGRPGELDVTVEVAVDQLARVRPVHSDRAQAEFLQAHGLDELVAQARAEWHARAHLGDLQALKARSRVGEAQALVDPSGLGAFRVLEWIVPPLG